jgi:pimeloyl-ACP methyl ester carboxylesterase
MTGAGRSTAEIRADSIPALDLALSAVKAACPAPRGAILALHGGGYTARYFDVPGQSFLRIAADAGYFVVAIDRPGYGAARDRPMSFDRQLPYLREAARWTLAQAGLPNESLFLHGHSIGGMLALLLAGADMDLPISGLSMTGSGAVGHERATAAIRARAESTDSHNESSPELRARLMMGPVGTFDPVIAAYDPARDVPSAVADLRDASTWSERLPEAAARCRVPVQFVVPEHDALWRSDDAAMRAAARLFADVPLVDIRVQGMAGHAIELHHLAQAHAHRALAFAEECRVHRATRAA